MLEQHAEYEPAAVSVPRERSGEWVSTGKAVSILSLSYRSLCELYKDMPEIAVLDRRARRGRGRPGFEWRRSQLEQIAKIRRECRIGFTQAVRVFAAMKESRI